jgi:hypothetical protein
MTRRNLIVALGIAALVLFILIVRSWDHASRQLVAQAVIVFVGLATATILLRSMSKSERN